MSIPAAPFLDVADRIGRRLCRDALWAGRQCNWLGWSLRLVRQSWVPAYCAHDLTLYEGTGGICLFLGWLAHFTGDPLEKVTLIGALDRVRAGAAESDPRYRFGFHSGLGGIGFTLIRVGELLEDDELVRQGLAVLASLGGVEPDGARLDVIGGSAGVIPVLLQAAARFGRDDLVATALDHGDTLLGKAVHSDRGWSWDTAGQAGQGHLIGYAHGAGGIACALLELHRATGEDRFRAAALEGLRYERSYYSAEQCNWPDLRLVATAPGQPLPDAPRYNATWCHGAPGVGCARLHARPLLGDDPEVDAEIDAALQTTAATLPYAVAPGQGNFSLCHGAGGCADVLLLAAQVLGRPQLRQTAEAIGQSGIAQFQQSEMPWPCGLLDGRETPNMMLGLAGIGYFYLRLHAPETVPSILALLPEALGTGAGAQTTEFGPVVQKFPA